MCVQMVRVGVSIWYGLVCRLERGWCVQVIRDWYQQMVMSGASRWLGVYVSRW